MPPLLPPAEPGRHLTRRPPRWNDRQASVAQLQHHRRGQYRNAWLADRLPSTDALAGQIANVINGNGAIGARPPSPFWGAQYETPLWQAGGGMYVADATGPGTIRDSARALTGDQLQYSVAPTSVHN